MMGFLLKKKKKSYFAQSPAANTSETYVAVFEELLIALQKIRINAVFGQI